MGFQYDLLGVKTFAGEWNCEAVVPTAGNAPCKFTWNSSWKLLIQRLAKTILRPYCQYCSTRRKWEKCKNTLVLQPIYEWDSSAPLSDSTLSATGHFLWAVFSHDILDLTPHDNPTEQSAQWPEDGCQKERDGWIHLNQSLIEQSVCKKPGRTPSTLTAKY